MYPLIFKIAGNGHGHDKKSTQSKPFINLIIAYVYQLNIFTCINDTYIIPQSVSPFAWCTQLAFPVMPMPALQRRRLCAK